MLKESGCGKLSHPLFVWMKGADFGKHPRERFYVVQRRAASCEIETGNFLVFYQSFSCFFILLPSVRHCPTCLLHKFSARIPIVSRPTSYYSFLFLWEQNEVCHSMFSNFLQYSLPIAGHHQFIISLLSLLSRLHTLRLCCILKNEQYAMRVSCRYFAVLPCIFTCCIVKMISVPYGGVFSWKA